jgi:hypothetical protein
MAAPSQEKLEEISVKPESTLESSQRRNFIRKATLATAAAGIGGLLLQKNILPESTASSALCTVTTPGKNTSGNLAVWKGAAEITDIGPAKLNSCSVCGTIHATNNNPNGVALYGSGIGCGVRGVTTSGEASGVNGEGPGVGVSGTAANTCGRGVQGLSCGLFGVGVYGRSFGKCGYGVYGYSCNTCGTGVYGVSTDGPGVYGNSNIFGVLGSSQSGTGVFGSSCCATGVFGKGKQYGLQGCSSPSGTGVHGKSETGPGVFGQSNTRYGVHGCSQCFVGVFGKGPMYGVQGCSPAIGLFGSAAGPSAVPIVAQGASGQTANLQQWEKNCGTSLSVVNKCGWLGLGTPTPSTTLNVNGSVSAKIVSVTTNYAMGVTDFGILAKASGGSLTVTLPGANTSAGMIVFVKKVDSSTNVVTVAASGTDKIEGKSSESLKDEYSSLELISDGSSNWYMVANEKK